MRYFIARESTAAPATTVLRDTQHLSAAYLGGVASGMLTLATGGRCYVGNEPDSKDPTDSTWQNWHARKTGYELAYQFATMRARMPCFEVRPTASGGDLKDGVLLVTVRFRYAPTAAVTVTLKSSDPLAVNIGDGDYPDSVHTFSPTDHNEPYTFAVVSTGVASAGTKATVRFVTASADPVFDGLEDRWTYNAGPKVASPVAKCDADAVADAVKMTNGASVGSVAVYGKETPAQIHEGRCRGSPSRTCTAAGKWTGAPLVCTPEKGGNPSTKASSAPVPTPTAAATSSAGDGDSEGDGDNPSRVVDHACLQHAGNIFLELSLLLCMMICLV